MATLLSSIQPPPFRVPLLDDQGQLVETWARFFLSAQAAIVQILAAKPAAFFGTVTMPLDDPSGFIDDFAGLGKATSIDLLDPNIALLNRNNQGWSGKNNYTSPANQPAITITGNATAGQSFGLYLQAGTNVTDYVLQAFTFNLSSAPLTLFGTGGIALGGSGAQANDPGANNVRVAGTLNVISDATVSGNASLLGQAQTFGLANASNGGLKLLACNIGPLAGAGFGGIAYRNTGEVWADPAFVFRGNGYAFESSTNAWLVTITPNARMSIGINSTDASALPLDKLHIRGGGIRIDNDTTGADFVRLTYLSPILTISTALTVSGAFTATSVTIPSIVGGSSTTQTLSFKTTTGVGATGADHIFQVGNNGATEALRIFNSSGVNIGADAIDPGTKNLRVYGSITAQTATFTGPGGVPIYGLSLGSLLRAGAANDNLYGINVTTTYATAGWGGITGYGIKIGDVSGVTTNYALYTGLGLVRFGGNVSTTGSIQAELLNLPNTGTAATSGTLTLVAGVKTVNTTAATATALIFFQRITAGGTIGFATTYTKVAGTSFTVSSDNILDTSTYGWWIVEVH